MISRGVVSPPRKIKIHYSSSRRMGFTLEDMFFKNDFGFSSHMFTLALFFYKSVLLIMTTVANARVCCPSGFKDWWSGTELV